MSNHISEVNSCKKLLVAGVAAAAMTCSTILGVVNANAQTTTGKTSWSNFEAASVRPSVSEALPRVKQAWGDVSGSVRLRHMSLRNLLLRAYDLQPAQLSGPAWLDDRFFDIVATAPAGAPNDQIPVMFQSLLSERFKLKFHRERHTARVYGLVAGKGGPRLKESLQAEPDAKNRYKVAGSGENMSGMGASTGKFGRFTWTLAANGLAHLEFAAITMDNLARYLSQPPLMAGLPVVDMTDLKGSYQVTLDFPVSALNGHPETLEEASDPSGGSVLDSLQKLGLNLVRRETSTEIFVVDHIEKTSTPN